MEFIFKEFIGWGGRYLGNQFLQSGMIYVLQRKELEDVLWEKKGGI